MSPRLSFLPLLALALLTPEGTAGDTLYAHEAEAAALRILRIDRRTGVPFEDPASPLLLRGSAPLARGTGTTLALGPRQRFLFAAGGTGLHVVRIFGNGTLEEVLGSPFGATGSLGGLHATRIGGRVLVFAVDTENALLRTFRVDPSTGVSSEAFSARPMGTPGGGAGVFVAKKRVFAVNATDGVVHAWDIVDRDGNLRGIASTPIDVPGIERPTAVAADRRGSLLVVNDRDGGRVGFVRLHRNRGTITEAASVTSPAGRTAVLGFTRNAKRYYGIGSLETYLVRRRRSLEFVTNVATPAGATAGVLSRREEGIYLAVGADLHYFALDPATGIPSPVTRVNALFSTPVEALVVARR